MNKVIGLLPAVSAVCGTALMAFLFVLLLVRYFAAVFAPKSAVSKLLTVPPRKKNAYGKWKDAFCFAAKWFIISRIIIFGTAAIYAAVTKNTGYFSNMYGYWAKWDAPHYLGLIRNWYVNEGDPRFHIVFFPMYPFICRILLPFFGGNADLSAVAVSNMSGYFAGVFLYMLTATDHSRKSAARAVKLFYLNPLSFFLSIPYTESIFLLLTIGSVYLARKGKFGSALILGAMCAASRLMGITVAIPIFYSMLSSDKEAGILTPKRAAVRFLSCFAVLIGVAAYLALNWAVTGNPFQFWIYQRDHWHNTTGSLWNTFTYIIEYALGSEMPMLAGTWIPTVLLIYGAIILIYSRLRRANAGDAAYSWAYMYMTIVPTWLISGPRYVSGLYALYPMLGDFTRKKWKDILTSVVFAAGLAFMSCMFAFTAGVY